MTDPKPARPSPLAVEAIYLEPAARLYERGRAILGRFPDARRIEVKSHWNIPGLHGNEGSAEDWLKIKRSTLVLGVRKTLDVRPNGVVEFMSRAASGTSTMFLAWGTQSAPAWLNIPDPGRIPA